MFAEGYEEVHVPHLKPKPFESNEVLLPDCFQLSVSCVLCIVHVVVNCGHLYLIHMLMKSSDM